MYYLCIMRDGNYTYCDDHLKCIEISIYNVEKQQLTAFEINYISKNKLIKRSDLWLPAVGSEGRGNWIKESKGTNKINEY